jgi:hypothetical protein
VRQRRTEPVCVLAEALRPHSIDATVFEPFVVAGLGGTPGVGTETTEFTVTLQNIGTAGTRTHQLQLRWQRENTLQGSSPVQERVVTEWAACGIACAVLWHYTGQRVLYSAGEGQGFDYWVGDEKQEQGMEISGTALEEASEMQRRHREKRDQLFSSLSVGGYVVIVGLARREIIFSYHAPEEAA